MAGHLAQIVLLALAATAVSADFNENFCKQLIPDYANHTMPNTPGIFFKDKYHMFIERKESRMTEYLDVFYSEGDEKAFYAAKAFEGSRKLWLFGKTDELITETDGDVCEEEFLVNSTALGGFLDIEIKSDGSVDLPIPSEIDKSLHWWYEGTKMLIERGPEILPDRGIPAVKFDTCEYRKEHDATSATQWFFSDQETIMPGQPNMPILLVAIVSEEDDRHFGPEPVVRTTRYDFTHHYTGIKDTDEHFELPTTNLCVNRPSAVDLNHPIPQIPRDFYFTAQQNVMTRDTAEPIPSINQIAEGFYADFNLSVITAREVTHGLESDWLHVADFFTGLQYNIDATTGKCDVLPIQTDDPAAKNAGNNTVRMRSPSGFLNLDSDKYEYMGVHRHLERGIECDVWSAYFDDGPILRNALYTWYFATEEWKNQHELDNLKPLPVSLKVTGEQMVIIRDMFEFTTENIFRAPDVSVCFNTTLTKNVRFALDEFYDKVVEGNEQNFHNALVKNILGVSGITSTIRLSELNVYPATVGGIAVEFKLLDKRPEKGDADVHVHQLTNEQAVEALQKAVNAGNFQVELEGGLGTRQVKSVKDSFEVINPRYKPKKPPTTTPGKGTASTVPGQSKATTVPDKGKATTIPDKGKATTVPDKGKATTVPDKGDAGSAKNQGDDDSSSDNMYTAGEMAGLAIGMIFLTTIAVFAGLFIYKRIVKKEPVDYLNMQNM